MSVAQQLEKAEREIRSILDEILTDCRCMAHVDLLPGMEEEAIEITLKRIILLVDDLKKTNEATLVGVRNMIKIMGPQ